MIYLTLHEHNREAPLLDQEPIDDIFIRPNGFISYYKVDSEGADMGAAFEVANLELHYVWNADGDAISIRNSHGSKRISHIKSDCPHRLTRETHLKGNLYILAIKT